MTKTKSIRFNLIFIIFSITYLAIIGFSASVLSNRSAAIVGLVTFILSLIASVFASKSKNDYMRVMRILGDIGSTVLVYSTLNSYFDFDKWIVITIIVIVYALLSIRIIRDL